MSFYFTFTTLEDIGQLKMLMDFMASQDLNYPHYHDWLMKTEDELGREKKKAILAFSGRKLVGNLIHQVCRDSGLGMLAEIKNGRIHPEMRERYFMSFMFRQLYKEYEGKYDGIIVDTRADQTGNKNFLISQKFIPIANLSLYEKNMQEIVMFKPLREDSKLLQPRIKKIIETRSL